MLKLLKNLRFHSQGREISDTDILNWANKKVRSAGRKSQIESFKVLCNFVYRGFYVRILIPLPEGVVF